MPRRVKQINLEQCRVPETRVTAVYDDELQKLLTDSLSQAGQIVPIVVVAHDGYYYVADGKHRLEEAQKRGDRTIQAVVSDGMPEDTLLLNLITNRTRGKVKASEMVAVIGELWSSFEMDSDQIREKTGFSREYIERLQAISLASPEVRDALDQELIGVGVAYEVSRLPDQVQQSYMVGRVETFKLSTQEAKRLVDEVLREMEKGGSPAPGPAVPRGPVIYTCDICKVEHDKRDLVLKVVCPNCWSAAWAAAKAAIPWGEQAPEGNVGGLTE